MPEKRPGRGFAALSPSRQREIASRGGRAAQESGRAHRWTRETAAVAGRAGGIISAWRRRRRKEAGDE